MGESVVLKEKKKILIVTAWFPNKENPLIGPFVKEQIDIINRYYGHLFEFKVLNPFLAVDIPNILFRKKRVFYDEYSFSEPPIKVIQAQPVIISHRFPIDLPLSNKRLLNRIWKEKLPHDYKPDLIWSVTLSGLFATDQLCEITGWNVPVIMQEHSVPIEMHLRYKWQNRMLSSAIERLSYYVPTSERLVKELAKLGYQGLYKVILNSTEEQYFQAKIEVNSSGPVKITSTGFLVYQKAVHRQIKAAAILNRKGYDFEWHLIGDGPEKTNLMQMANKEGLASKIIFHGAVPRSDISNYLKKADVFVLSSRFENCPFALLEAQAMGLPCIVTRNDASEKVLLEGCGYSVEQDEEGKNLAQALELYINKGPYKSESIRTKAREAFHPSVFASNFKQVFGELLAS